MSLKNFYQTYNGDTEDETLRKKLQLNKIALFIFCLFFFTIIIIWKLNADSSPHETLKNNFLNKKEQKWINNQKKPLKVGITSIPNQIIYDRDNKPHGFSIDIFHQIQLLLGVNFQYIPFKTWDALVDAGKKKKIDIVFLAQKTESRLAYFDFTDRVLSQQNKIIVQTSNHSISDIKTLFGKKNSYCSRKCYL
ncbi:transporter substrate-binding domain-containing protein [Sulfurimonas sp.]